MKYFFLSILVISINTVAQAAEEPMTDYSFECVAKAIMTSSFLKLDAGIDPSGGFNMSLSATGNWRNLNGLNFIAKRTPTNTKTIFNSNRAQNPAITLTIDWSKEIAKNTFHGTLLEKTTIQSQPIDLACLVSGM